nr:Recombination protein RecT [Pseudomonas aeruginosa]
MSDKFQIAVAIIAEQEDKFIMLVESSETEVMIKIELLIASQGMMNYDYQCKSATTNALRLRNAISQDAANGWTLNLSRELANLVRRDGQVVMDVSWTGMVMVPVNHGAIGDCIDEWVYSEDNFEYRGQRHSPSHTYNPFDMNADRREIVGCFVEAHLPDGGVHVQAVTAEEIIAAGDASELWIRKKIGPSVDYEDSMGKMSAIKIARNYWRQTGSKLDGVIQYVNTEAGEAFSSNVVPVEDVQRYMAAAHVVESEPWPTSNQVNELPEPTVDPEQAAEPEVAEPARADHVFEGVVVRDRSQVAPPADIPGMVIMKVGEDVRRARDANSCEPPFVYVSSWAVDAPDNAVTELKSAEYVALSQGE